MQTDSYVNELRQLMKCEDATKLETLPRWIDTHTHSDKETERQEDRMILFTGVILSSIIRNGSHMGHALSSLSPRKPFRSNLQSSCALVAFSPSFRVFTSLKLCVNFSSHSRDCICHSGGRWSKKGIRCWQGMSLFTVLLNIWHVARAHCV